MSPSSALHFLVLAACEHASIGCLWVKELASDAMREAKRALELVAEILLVIGYLLILNSLALLLIQLHDLL